MLRIVSFALLALGAALPCAAQYPDRPLTLLAGFPAGGLVDVSELVQARPDGYTVLLTPQSSLVIAPQLNPNLSYKTPDEYDPVINLIAYYPLLVVNADAEWTTIQEFIAEARANPGKLRVGTHGEGTASHLNLEELIFRSGAKLTPVPYAGWGQSSPALLGKHIEAVVAQPGEAKPLVDGKRMRA